MTGQDLPDTVGLRVQAHARRIAAAHAVTFSWAAGLSRLMQELSSRTGATDRFQRVEATPFGTPLPVSRPLGSSSAAADPGGVPIPPVMGGVGRTPSPTAPPSSRDAHTALPPTELPGHVRTRVERVLQTPLPDIAVHTDRAADAAARAADADAVTLGEHVYFRQGRYRPEEPAGFALLTHEATHVSESHTRRHGDPSDTAAAEDRALAVERAALTADPGARDVASAPATSTPPGESRAIAVLATMAMPDHSAISSAATASPSKAASAQSDLLTARTPAATNPVAAMPAAAPAAGTALRAAADRQLAPSPPPVDLDALRRSLIEEMKRVMRSEYERGA